MEQELDMKALDMRIGSVSQTCALLTMKATDFRATERCRHKRPFLVHSHTVVGTGDTIHWAVQHPHKFDIASHNKYIKN